MNEITKGSHCPVAIKFNGSVTLIDGQALVIALWRQVLLKTWVDFFIRAIYQRGVEYSRGLVWF